jgi:hypothetical protein
VCSASRLEETGGGYCEVDGSGGLWWEFGQKIAKLKAAPKLLQLPSNKRVVVRRHRRKRLIDDSTPRTKRNSIFVALLFSALLIFFI